ncbi:hypothetical protein O0I10_003764 [Lichtheimia ornata]|uniref:Uncharacterized protein n=1 Tax=Lichtheimia ornata TaxID=688661 RepID=A0AAD7Y2D3_9FUNG|nr:uncharacterized protein O0I10_003764 [Lichtheimia ornata]KAJ8660307.1 hypothetical protein O0I10_003764 [Lichtheimia ornata]
MLVNIDTLRECTESWSRITQEGGKVLASIDRSDPSKTVPALTKVMQGLKDVLEKMYAEYDRVMERSNKSHGNDAAAGYQSDLETLSKYLEMYDQEYMLKESIQSIVKERGCYTQQHLNGCSALWITEPYVDQQFVQNVIQSNSS